MFAAVPQQKTLKMLTRARHDLSDDAAQTDQIAHGFVIGVRHPDGRQLAGSVKTRKHGGVTAIRLHTIAGLVRNQGHGCVVAGPKGGRADGVYLKIIARLQAEAMRLGEVIFLSEGEIALTSALVNSENLANRMWEYWRRRAGMDQMARG